MKESRAKLILKYVLPTILSQCAFFLFTIIDGIFVGHGVGADGLGAVNLAQPLVMVIGAAFMHATISTLVVAALFTLIGTLFTRPLAVLLGAEGVYVKMVCDYLFWYTAFTIPSALSATLQGFGRNDGAPVFC